MLPRPAWLAIGVIAAALAAALAGTLGADAPESIAAAAGLAALAMAVATLCDATGRRQLVPPLAIASLGAAAVAVRLIGGLLAGAGPAAPTPIPTGSGTWQATVLAAHTANGQQIATIETGDPPLSCAVQFPALPRLIAGDTVAWTGWFEKLGDDGYDQFLAASGVDASCQAKDLVLVRHDDSPAGRLEAFRQASGDALQRVLPEPGGGLAAAILIGLRDRVDRNVAASFTTAGVSHIIAISGWNISIVAATIAALLRGLVGRRRRAIVTIVAILAYTLFAGASASVVRAAAMAAVALLAQETGRGSRVLVTLAWAVAAILLVEPAIVTDVGFELSATATAGLVMWATPLTALFGRKMPWMPTAIGESLGVSMAAQAATLPIALLIFGRLALISPLANLVAVPLVPPAMAAGALAFGAGWLAALGFPGWLAGLIAMPAWALFAALIGVVGVAASIPGANETLPFPANVAAAALAVILIWRLQRLLAHDKGKRPAEARRAPASGRTAGHDSGANAAGRSRSRGKPRTANRVRWVVVGAAFLAALAGCVIASRPDGSVHVVVLDVGQGDAILLEGDAGGRILVDGGPDGAALMNALDRYVPAWDRHLQAIILTHPHDDHVVGLTTVLQRYRVDQAFESGWAVQTPAYRAWLGALAAGGLRDQKLRTGDRLQLDDITLQVLWPDDGAVRPDNLDPAATENRKTNDSSIILLGTYENRRFLLTGDAEDDVDPVLLDRGLPTVDVLKVAHHGSGTASSDAFLAAVRPGAALISVGANNSYGHPAPSTMTRLRAHSGSVLRTDLSGSIEVTIDAAGVTISPSKSGVAGAPTGGSRAIRPIQAGRVALLYDPTDVRSQPPRIRGPVYVAAAAGLAPLSLEGRRRDCGLAGIACGVSWAPARSPPRGIGRSLA